MDIIADSLTKIRNAIMRKQKTVEVKKTGFLDNILTILQREGYILGFEPNNKNKYSYIVKLKYTEKGSPAILGLEKVSKGSRRVYVGKKSIPSVYNNYGIAIVSTSKGVLTDKEARSIGVGGEVICTIW